MLDEADRLMDMGFEPQITKIIEHYYFLVLASHVHFLVLASHVHSRIQQWGGVHQDLPPLDVARNVKLSEC